MKSIRNLFTWAGTLLLCFQLLGQVQSFGIQPSVGNSASIENPALCQGFPLQICGSYTFDDNFPLSFVSLDVPDVIYSIDFIDEQTKTFCISILEQTYANTACADISVTLVFSNSSNTMTSITTNSLTLCIDQIQCECLFTEITNIKCYNNGTADFEDDYWTFDILVESTLNGNSSFSIDPLGISGYYGVSQTVIVGSIVDTPNITITVIDSEFPDDCNVKYELEAPDTCSDGCGLFASALVGECSDGGTEAVLSDDVYDVEIDITSNSLDAWELYQTFTSDNTSFLIGSGVGNAKFILEDVAIIYGDWVLSVSLQNDPTCTSIDLVQAPSFCSGCMTANIADIICNDQGTPFDSDDTWSFDLLVTGGTGSEFKIPEFGIQGFYGEVLTVEVGLIVDCFDLTIFDFDNPVECQSVIVVCPPETCSNGGIGCDLLVDFGKKECVKVGGSPGFEFSLDIKGTNDACWQVIKSDLNGLDEILVENSGDKSLTLGPFELADFNLRVELCDNSDCNVSFFVEAPDCPGLQDSEIDIRSTNNSIYPNPISDSEITLNLDDSVVRISIYDALGHLVDSFIPSSGLSKYHLDLQNGLYLFQLEKDNGRVEIVRIVKQ